MLSSAHTQLGIHGGTYFAVYSRSHKFLTNSLLFHKLVVVIWPYEGEYIQPATKAFIRSAKNYVYAIRR